MCDIKYCKDCKYSILSGGIGKVLRCVHPKVIKNNITADNISLTTELSGELCSETRKGYWFVTCGIKGKLWESKYSTEEFIKTFKR
jgi:hypothetical protein